ncbi:hypothetical protein AMS68_003087 [Peltaster fructicola]|uniref:Ribophorin II C-terminal domain-containing protein n=1 Tax=Peltaster fructicola TaxID=286661 RepID=A0A6H0XSY4_9PEZI|nr:hypothetical protein AMS68_003087 [Peltaster fructicola]
MKNHTSIRCLLISLLTTVTAAASWTFDDGQLSIRGKNAAVDSGVKEKLSATKALSSNAITLAPSDALKITLTTKEGSSTKKPHQAFLSLRDTTTGLEDAYAFSVKENGKAKLEITQKDIPIALLAQSRSLEASVIIASFGSATPYKQHVFDLSPSFDNNSPAPSSEAAERLSKKDEIHHIFKADARSPPRLVSLVFLLAVLGALPVLLAAWALLGANVDHASAAFGENPVAHGLFFGSILAMEGVFFLYYTSWNLFQLLPVAAVVGLVAYISGSRGLTEVQGRRLAGKR